MDSYTAIRVIAFRTVQAPDREYLLRKVMRWYSKTFFTPLEAVEEIPLDDLMRTYYEDLFEGMTAEDLEAEQEKLLITEEERVKKIMDEEASDAEMFEMARQLADAEKRKKAKPTDPKADQQQQTIAPMRHPVPGLLKQVREAPEADLPAGGTPPGITMTFMDEGDLQAEIAAHEALADGRGKK